MRMGRVLLLLLLGACGASGEAPLDRSAGARPSEVVALLTGDVRDYDFLTEVLAPLVPVGTWPMSFREALTRLLPVPSGIDPRVDSPVVVAVLGDLADPQWAAVFHADLADVTLTEGGPRGTQLAAPTVAVDGERVVAASSRDVLRRVYGWLAYGDLPQVRTGWRVELGSAAVASVSRHGEELLRRWRGRALQDIAEERAGHGAPPLAEPEAVVDWLSRRVSTTLALLDDVQAITAVLASAHDGAHLHVELVARRGTDLERALVADTPGEVPLVALPASTTFGWWRARPSSVSWAELFVGAAGPRLEPGLAADLTGAWASEPEPILALGEGPQGPWALAGSPTPWVPALEAALGSRFAQALLGAALGCERADTRLRNGRAALCGGANLWLKEGNDGWMLAVAQSAPQVRWGGRGAGTLGSHPIAAPLLPDRASGVLYFDSARLPGALRLLSGLPGGARETAHEVPVVMSWRPGVGTLVVDLRMAPHAAEQVAASASVFDAP